MLLSGLILFILRILEILLQNKKKRAVDKRPRTMSGAVTNRAYRNRQRAVDKRPRTMSGAVTNRAYRNRQQTLDKTPRNTSGVVTNRAYRNRQQTPANIRIRRDCPTETAYRAEKLAELFHRKNNNSR